MATGDDREQGLRALHSALPAAVEANVELHLETDLAPREFRAFLDDIDHPMVKVNYDMGNSAALGYSPAEEFSAYGIAGARVDQVLKFEGLERQQATEAGPGDIVLINGIEGIGIGVTLTDIENPQPLPMLKVDEPTLTIQEIRAIFRKLGLEPRVVGAVPATLNPKSKTQPLRV